MRFLVQELMSPVDDPIGRRAAARTSIARTSMGGHVRASEGESLCFASSTSRANRWMRDSRAEVTFCRWVRLKAVTAFGLSKRSTIARSRGELIRSMHSLWAKVQTRASALITTTAANTRAPSHVVIDVFALGKRLAVPS